MPSKTARIWSFDSQIGSAMMMNEATRAQITAMKICVGAGYH